MTAKSRTNLISEFQTGDVPDGDDYQDLIDSAVNLTDSSAQTVTSKLTISGGMETTTVTAQRVFSSAARFTGTVSAQQIFAVTASATQFTAVTFRSTTVSAVNVVLDNLRINTSSRNLGSTRLTNVGIGTAAPSEGLHIVVSGDSNFRIDVPTTVVASAGVSGPATPASVAGFIPVMINGVRKKIAFYEP